MMWQSSMLISLLVLSPEQIIVGIWVKQNIYYRGPLVVLIARHKDILVN